MKNFKIRETMRLLTETMHAISPLHRTDQLPVKKRYSKAYIRCYTCRRKSIENKLTGHLIFGEAECTLCNLNVIACRTFQDVTTDSANRVCNHRFEFNKPFDHLYSEVSQNIKRRKSGESQAIAVAKGLETYLSKLGRLEDQEPWMSAILRSREMIKEIRLRGTAPSNELNNNENIPGGYAFSHSDGPYSTPFRENGKCVLPIKLYRVRNCDLPECSEAKGSPAESLYCIAEGESTKEPRVHKPLFETQPSSAPTLPAGTSSSSSAPRATPHKTLPRKPSGPQATPRGTHPTARSAPEKNEVVVTGFLDTPTDGYYYVSRRALEECPMCYAALCPSRFTVNVQTFLLTTVCIACGLTIYLVFEPPDGSAPRVAIVTEDQRLRMARPSTKGSGKEETNKPRRPFTMQSD
ncbi:uncharacterized protein LOC119588780 isoform X2 [Penaeus monodon]|uniref:uncharacterized protein LOC119588780 isoform X2 n=1 Tax=Penaeus monodon TaxID=6687 RepID=UPI0018A7C2F6|nr:uncharacterized protein LOC119588780 isoform X2 [Penaeus monodon]